MFTEIDDFLPSSRMLLFSENASLTLLQTLHYFNLSFTLSYSILCIAVVNAYCEGACEGKLHAG